MPDHVHLLLQPLPLEVTDPDQGYFDLAEILHSIKSFSAHELQRKTGWQGRVWQHESYDRIVRDAEELAEKWQYIANNAVLKDLAASPESYRWFWPGEQGEMESEERAAGPAAQAGTLAPPAEEPGGASVPACAPRRGPVEPEQVSVDIAFRVIADHIRCLTLAVADGILPANDGRGYVLRRILRRAVRYGRNLGFHEPFFFKLVAVVAEQLGDVFPEIRRRQPVIETTLRAEEESFNVTLDRGLELFEQVVAGLGGSAAVFPAADAFKLYDTSGFPLDLTELMARERGLTVDGAGFEELMEAQRQRARADHARKKSVISVAADRLAVGATRFVGYETLASESRVEAVVAIEGRDQVGVVLDCTPFYAEMGGQVGDTGQLGDWPVVDTQKQGELVAHRVPIGGAGLPEVGSAIRAAVDAERRANIQRHHTVTHLFHWALHEVVSREAQQKGSLVAPDRLRFDFNHPAGLTPQQVADIERLVNERVTENAPIHWFEMPYAEVRGHPNVMQVFGDKYGATVRVVQIGGRPGQLDGYSMELCGGTHTTTTGAIGLFKIAKEGGIATGVRRIEAVAGPAAAAWLEELQQQEQAEVEKARQREQEKAQAKQTQAALQQEAPALAEKLLGQLTDGLIVADLGDANAELLRAVVDALKVKLSSAVVVLGGVGDGKVALICYVTPDRVKQGQKAGQIIGQVAKLCGGGGGGKPDLAQAGGKQPEKLAAALAAVPAIVSS